MNNVRRNLLLGVPVTLALATLTTVVLGNNPPPPAQPTSVGGSFIKIGSFYINAARIDYALDEGDRMVIAFGESSKPSLTLTGADAAKMREWLDGRLSASATSVRRGPQDSSRGQHPEPPQGNQ